MNPRLSVQLRARYSIPRLGAEVRRARTVNMSRSGLLVELLDETPGLVLADAVAIEIQLPALNARQPRCLFSHGRVVRIEREGSCQRIALAVEFMEFRDADLTAAAMLRAASSFLM